MAGVDPARIVLNESETRGAAVVPLEGVDAIFNLHSNHNAAATGDVVHGKLRTRLMEKIS
jgi:hypothetical protein